MNVKIQHIGRLITFLAGLIFLAHAVVPHHHHNSKICLESSQHPREDHSHEHKSDSGDRPYDHKKDIQSCILYQVIPNQNNQTQKISKSGNANIKLPALFFAALFPEIENNSVKTTEHSYFPILQSDYSVFVSKCFGLRAPPIV